jgi:hypothetical protein
MQPNIGSSLQMGARASPFAGSQVLLDIAARHSLRLA